MERLIEYAGHHSLLAAAAVLLAAIVIAYELRVRAQSVAAASPQDVIRLMNQNALVLDILQFGSIEPDELFGPRRGPDSAPAGSPATEAPAIKPPAS